MRVLLAAGGTGGHLIPAIRISEAIVRQHTGAEFLFVGSNRGFEERVISARHQSYAGLPARGLSRRKLWRNFPALYQNWRAGRIAVGIVREFGPDAAIGCGGYASYFPIRACAKAAIPYVLQEQNRQPGLATKWLSSGADTVFVAFDETRAALPNARNIQWSGNPVDPRLSTLSREEARRAWHLPADATVILVTGGSTGARSINDNIVRSLKTPNPSSLIHLLWQTGAQGVDWNGKAASGWLVHPFTFSDKMTEAFVAADLIVARAGALTISEICAAGRPAILVPYPQATGDHQTHNARALVNAGGAHLIEDHRMVGESLVDFVLPLLGDQMQLAKMGEANRSLGRPDAADRVARRVIELATKTSPGSRAAQGRG